MTLVGLEFAASASGTVSGLVGVFAANEIWRRFNQELVKQLVNDQPFDVGISLGMVLLQHQTAFTVA